MEGTYQRYEFRLDYSNGAMAIVRAEGLDIEEARADAIRNNSDPAGDGAWVIYTTLLATIDLEPQVALVKVS